MATKSTAPARQSTYPQGGSGEPGTQRQRIEATNLDAPDGPLVTYAPGPDATPEGELTALAAVYRFLLDRHERRDDDIAADDAENEAEHGE